MKHLKLLVAASLLIGAAIVGSVGAWAEECNRKTVGAGRPVRAVARRQHCSGCSSA